MAAGAAIGQQDQQVEALHARATVINGLSNLLRYPTRRDPRFPLPDYMRAGGATAAVFTVALVEDFATTAKRFNEVLVGIEARDDTRIARTADDIRAAKADGAQCIVLGFQGSEPIDGDIEYLDVFRRLGLRVLQLTYQRRNVAADGCGEAADGGLSVFGKTLVGACNDMGILIDLSHVGYRSTMETIEHSADPVAFTHVNLHSQNPLPRNKTDEQIRKVAERGGVIGINAIARLLSPRGEDEGATISEFVDQVEQVVQMVGPDHVGIGLDVNEDMTEEDFLERRKGFLKTYPELSTGKEFPFDHYYVRDLTVATLQNLTAALVERGYSDDDVMSILGGSFLRVFDAVWTG